MYQWTRTIIEVKGFPVKVYVNEPKTEAVLFYCFGRYSKLSCYNNPGMDVLDFATDFLLGTEDNVIKFSDYENSFENTAIIEADKIAA